MSKKLNVHIYPSPLTNESRIEKEVISLLDLRLVEEIIVIGYNPGNLPKESSFHDQVKFVRINTFCPFDRLRIIRHLAFFEFSVRAFFYITKSEVSIVNCHSLHVLPMCAFLKKFKKLKLIYDTHELETEVAGSKGILKCLSKLIERLCIKYVDYLIVVSKSIEHWYKREYNLDKVVTIRNIPKLKCKEPEKNNYLRQNFNIPHNAIVFIYQGLLSPVRGINVMLEVFKVLSVDKFHIVFLGDGPLKPELVRVSKQSENIHYLSKVTTEELPFLTSGADIGIHMILNNCLNHYYCLPNKFFEYILSGLPVMVSDLPEMREIVVSNDIGWLVEPQTERIIAAINGITLEELEHKKQNTKLARKKYSWSEEAIKYSEVY